MKTYKTLRNVNRKLMFVGYTGTQIVSVFGLVLVIGLANFACGIFLLVGAIWWSKKNSRQVSEGDYEYVSTIQLQLKNVRKLDGSLLVIFFQIVSTTSPIAFGLGG